MKPLIKQPTPTQPRKAYDYIDVDNFTPVTDFIILSHNESDTGSSATRLATTEDGDFVMQRVNVMFGEAETLQEGYIDLTKDFKVGGEGADFVYKHLLNKGLLFEFVDGLNGTMSSAFVEKDITYEVWYKPQEWLSVKAIPAKRAAQYLDMEGNEVGKPNVGRVVATSIFERAVVQ
jgi:hypothetical protein